MTKDTHPPTDINLAMQALQHKVQRKLGECMLRLMMYEGLLKRMLGNIHIKATANKQIPTEAERAAQVSRETLGALISTFINGYLVTDSSAGVLHDEPDPSDGPDDSWLSMKISIGMADEDYDEVTRGLRELVKMRNELVHHLLEKSDVFSEDGCRAAVVHLEECALKIAAHYTQLTGFAKNLQEAHFAASSFLQSERFTDVLVHGINPDGTVCWARSTIVKCLRNAEAVCSDDGWTLLDSAITFISRNSKDQYPSKYGCSTWAKVLKKSGQFDVRLTHRPDGSGKQHWYRSKAKADDHPKLAAGKKNRLRKPSRLQEK